MCEYCKQKTNNILTKRDNYAITLGYNNLLSFCPDSWDLRLVNIDADEKVIFVQSNFCINYCPICGRYLN